MTYTLQAVENSDEKTDLVKRFWNGSLIIVVASILGGLLAWNEPHPMAIALAILVGGIFILGIDLAVAFRASSRRSKS